MTEERRLVSREELAAIAARDAELSPCDCGPKDRPLEERAEGWFHRTYGTNTVHVGMTQDERDRRTLLAALPQPATEPAPRHCRDCAGSHVSSTGDYSECPGLPQPAAQPSAEVERLRELLRESIEEAHAYGLVSHHHDPTDKTGWNVKGIETCGYALCVQSLAALAGSDRP